MNSQSNGRRNLAPKPAVVVRASTVSQLTSLATLGIDPRRFLEHLVPLCRGHVTSIGKLRLVPLDVAMTKLRELAQHADHENAQPSNDVHDDALESVDQILAAVGRRRVGGAR